MTKRPLRAPSTTSILIGFLAILFLGAFPRAFSRARFAKIRQMILGMPYEVIFIVRFAQIAFRANLMASGIVGGGFSHK
jgi:hypothetical protein